MIWILLGVLFVSLSLTYAWWTKARVVCLKQDIYDIRDSLFDTALDLEAFDDPAYQQSRDHFNHIASSAELMTISFLTVAICQIDGPRRALSKSSNLELQQAIDKCVGDCTRRILKYLLFQTFTGWIVVSLITASKLKEVADRKAFGAIERWLISSSAEEISAARRNFRAAGNNGSFPPKMQAAG